MDSVFLLRLKELGYEIDEAMERCLNDEAFYLQCIEMTMEDDAFHHLGQALDNEDHQSAFEYAHTLKGVWSNIGLTQLYHKIIPIVESLRHGQIHGLKDDYDKLALEYQKIQKLYHQLHKKQ